MLTRVPFFALYLLAIGVYASSPAAILVGKWSWHDIDAGGVVIFQPDHTYVMTDSYGFDRREDKNGKWDVEGNRLTISWPNGEKRRYVILKATSRTLVLRSAAAGVERLSRLK